MGYEYENDVPSMSRRKDATGVETYSSQILVLVYESFRLLVYPSILSTICR